MAEAKMHVKSSLILRGSKGGRVKRVELQFMPIKRKWRILIDGKALPKRFSDRVSAMKEFERQKTKSKEEQ